MKGKDINSFGYFKVRIVDTTHKYRISSKKNSNYVYNVDVKEKLLSYKDSTRNFISFDDRRSSVNLLRNLRYPGQI